MCGPSRRTYAPFPFPSGFRFRPDDHVLINYFLKKKINNEVIPYNFIRSVNVYNHSPRDLIEAHPNQGDDIWYFFTPSKDRKRLYRAAGDGYWKCHGTKRQIYDQNNIHIGYKNSLIFYEGEPRKGKETLWCMKEYIFVDQRPRQKNGMRVDNCVACRIHMRTRRRASRNKNKRLLSSLAERSIGKATRFLNMRRKRRTN